jgi:glycosyltransferase involved in cell wall biosynthesis
MAVRWGMPTSRIEVVYNARPPDHQTATVSQAEARVQLGLDPTRPILLTVARLLPWKGVDAFIRVMDAVPDLQYIVVGDGIARADFEQTAQDHNVVNRVTFTGRIPPEQVAVYMRAADYVGLYSGYEGLSHVLVESLNTGTPVIASRKGGNPEIVRDGENGLLAPYEDDEALRFILRTAFAPGQRDALAANTRVGLEMFDYDRMVLNTVGALRRLMR